jgi:AcrR family transcriptional regulator
VSFFHFSGTLVSNEVKKTRRKLRLAPDERRRHIVEEALRFFADHGFEANTRVLAQRIGITQPLLFRYFSTKEELIETVFELAQKRLTRRDWLSFIQKSEGDIRTRLINFFYSYASESYDFDWIRLYMFAGLAGGKLNRRYIKLVTEPVLRAIAHEIREHFQSPKSQISREEIEYLWVFHGGLYYYAIRQRIYGVPADPNALAKIVETMVDALISGFDQFLKRAPAKKLRARDGAASR